MFIEIINTKMISRLDAGPSERLVDTNSGYQPGEDLPSCSLVFCLAFFRMNSHNDIDNIQWCKSYFPFTLFTGSSFQEGLKLASIPTFHFPQLFQTLMTFHLISHSTQFLIPTRCHQTNTNPTHIHLSPTMMNLTTTPTVTPQAPHR